MSTLVPSHDPPHNSAEDETDEQQMWCVYISEAAYPWRGPFGKGSTKFFREYPVPLTRQEAKETVEACPGQNPQILPYPPPYTKSCRCDACDGTGKCDACNGTGVVWIPDTEA